MTRLLAPALLLLLASSCRQNALPSFIDGELAAGIPPGAVAVAGVELEQVRSSPLFPRVRDLLPASAALDEAALAYAMSDGKDLLVVARGRFAQAPPGTSLISLGIVAAGSPALVTAAAAQFKTGRTGSPELLAHATNAPVWAVFQGGKTLPVTGNLANINRLLRATQFATLTARVENGLDVSIAGTCATPQEAERLEQTFRGMLSLTRAAGAKNRELAQLYDAVRIARQEAVVTLGLAAPQSLAEYLLRP